nr:hypothetical protein [Spirochaetaceae bacterium]
VGITNYNSGLSEFGRSVNDLFGSNNDFIPILFSVLQLVAGVLLLVSLFTGFIPGRVLSISLLVIFIFWAITIVMKYFMNDLFEPDFVSWLARVSPQLVILSSLWLITKSSN